MATGGIQFKGDWEKAAKTLGVAKATLKEKVKQAIFQEAHFLAGRVKEYIGDASHFEPLSPSTLKLRKLRGFGGDKPLNASGALKGSISVMPNSPSMKHFVGVLRRARTKDGKSLVNVAEVHENGATIVLHMTAKMRKFLFGVLFKDEPKTMGPTSAHAGTGILVIKIPARPFLSPIFAQYGPTSGRRVYERLAKLLGGSFGTP